MKPHCIVIRTNLSAHYSSLVLVMFEHVRLISLYLFLSLLCHFALCNVRRKRHWVEEDFAKRDDVKDQKLLIISLDGFRHDYLKHLPETNNFTSFITDGVYAPKGILNAFSTKTFPNHYTIVTGLYEESHGIIANELYIPELDRSVKLTENDHNASTYIDPDSHDANVIFKGDPIWNTLTTARGSDDRIGCMMWPGCSFSFMIEGKRVARHLDYDKSLSWEARVDTVVRRWLKQADVEFALLYYHEPDSTGHAYGPDSPEIRAMVLELNEKLGYLLRQIEFVGLTDKLNIILTSDHGMAPVKQHVPVSVQTELYERFLWSDVIWNVKPPEGQTDALIVNLRAAIPPSQGTVYRKADLPLEYHYNRTDRTMPVVVVAKEYNVLLSDDEDWYNLKGTHGYSNNVPEMWPIFMAKGPQFVKGERTTPRDFENVDIYNLMCLVLNIDPTPNNGSIARAKHLLINGANHTEHDGGEHENEELSWSQLGTSLIIVSTCSLAAIVFTLCLYAGYSFSNGRKRAATRTQNAYKPIHRMAGPAVRPGFLSSSVGMHDLDLASELSDSSDEETSLNVQFKPNV